MKISPAINLLLIVSLFSANTYAGFDVGNGGDIIWCPSSRDYYSLDYVLTKNKSTHKNTRKVSSLKDSLNKISVLMAEKIPALSESFNEFVAQMSNQDDFSKKYVWVSSYNLPDVRDEESGNIPGTCGLTFFGAISIFQAIVRKENSNSSFPRGQIILQYNPDIILNLTGPLQRSYLYVHEWLWNICTSSTQNRQVNSFLHSTSLDKLTALEVRDKLIQLGINPDSPK